MSSKSKERILRVNDMTMIESLEFLDASVPSFGHAFAVG